MRAHCGLQHVYIQLLLPPQAVHVARIDLCQTDVGFRRGIHAQVLFCNVMGAHHAIGTLDLVEVIFGSRHDDDEELEEGR